MARTVAARAPADGAGPAAKPARARTSKAPASKASREKAPARDAEPAAKAASRRKAPSKNASAPAEAAKAAKPKTPRKPRRKLLFSKGDYAVYPSHGVGRITGVERSKIDGFDLQLFVIFFAAEKMTLRVPVEKAAALGLRRISSKETMERVLTTLGGRARAKRTMWSRRAQEYETKINSGDPVAVAEVVRDLYRPAGQPEQSYSERQMYEAALDRLVTEFSLVEKLDLGAATERIEAVLGG